MHESKFLSNKIMQGMPQFRNYIEIFYNLLLFGMNLQYCEEENK